MSAKTRLTTLNERLKTKLISKGIEIGSDVNTTTALIAKLENLEECTADKYYQNMTDWTYFFYEDARKAELANLEYADTVNGVNFDFAFGHLKNGNITVLPELNLSNAEYCRRLCILSQYITEVKDLNTSKCKSFAEAFSQCSRLVKIGSINVSAATAKVPMFDGGSSYSPFHNMFQSCSSLEEVSFVGEIKVGNINLSSCTKLKKASITGLINALSSTPAYPGDATYTKITFSTAAVNKAFETSSGANDGASSSEWNSAVSAKSAWNIITG